jgi:membrane protease subunit HflC
MINDWIVMRHWTKYVVIFGVFALFIIISSGCFQVKEGRKALVIRMGQLVGGHTPVNYGPGLHFKWPIIDRVVPLDFRLQTLAEMTSRILTQQQKFVLVDYYVKWRIVDPALYYQRTQGQSGVTDRLIRQTVNDVLRALFGKHSLSEVVAFQRNEIIQSLQHEVNQRADYLGVHVIDVRIKRIDLPSEVSDAIYQTMSAKRKRDATEYRSEGRAKAEKIRAEADARAHVIRSSAVSKAADIRAQGDLQANTLFQQAYLKAPDFFDLYLSLDATKQALTQDDQVIISLEDGLFKLLSHAPSAK